jgi:DNA-binding transcriptional LysR family regulator
MAMDLQIDLLRAFHEVVESGSFTRAARRLNRVQSAVSMQIKRLEEVAGHRLFERSGRRIALTDEGVMLLGYARQMLSLNQEALTSLRLPAMGGVVRLGASDVASYLLPDILTRFAAAYPHLQLEIHCDRSWHLLDGLDRGDLDLALVTQHRGRPPGRLVREEPLVWAAARGGRAQEREPVPLALFGHGCIYREAALRALDACERRWRIAYSSVNPAGLRAAVDAGLAVTTAIRSMVHENMQVLGAVEGFPPLPPVRISLHQAAREATAPVARLASDIIGAAPSDPA